MRRRAILLPAALALALALGACGTDDGDDAEPAATTTTTTTTTAAAAPTPAIWPPPDAEPFPSAEDAALDFAREFLRMPDASLAEPTAGDAADLVGVRPYADRGPTTVVEVADTADGWVVTGATSDQLVVTDPQPGGLLTQPLVVRGEGTANEGTVHVEVRELGSTDAIAFEFTTAGSMGEMGPFEATLELDAEPDVAVLVVFAPDVSDEAAIGYATVLILGT